MDEEKRTILLSNIEMRNKEIQAYQINIDNYTRAIAKIDEEQSDDPDMQSFKQIMQTNLASEKREQKKSMIIRDVMQDQLNEA